MLRRGCWAACLAHSLRDSYLSCKKAMCNSESSLSTMTVMAHYLGHSQRGKPHVLHPLDLQVYFIILILQMRKLGHQELCKFLKSKRDSGLNPMLFLCTIPSPKMTPAIHPLAPLSCPDQHKHDDSGQNPPLYGPKPKI